ncbi:ABC transporter permease [Radiobacillus sp. PE A8.2]|uniref:ABC transporter permease n=1 Tax=Radiobacillus sp. PE A8.2 TaxID=3380349 RepID=UPI00389110A3
MAMLKIIIRKMFNNRWLTGSLFLGLLITVALVSSIPTYTSSVLQKLLVSDLENYQLENSQYPSMFSFSVNFTKDDEINQLTMLDEVETYNKQLISATTIPVKTDVSILSSIPLQVTREQSTASTQTQQSGKLLAFTEIEQHINITDGRLPNDELVDGAYEAIVPERALLERDIVLGTTFLVGEGESQFLVKPVATFKAKDNYDPYWTLSPEVYRNDFIIAEQLYRQEFLPNNPQLLETSRFITNFDYQSITSENIQTLLSLERKVNATVSSMMETIILTDFPAQTLLSTYGQKEEQLRTMLWSLNVPVLVMLSIYLYMVSRLIVNRQLNEIAILASRGAKRTQIMLIYFIEVSILGSIAFLFGPFIGAYLCNLLGATNGFLEFVQRTALPINIRPESYLYGCIAVIASIVMTMIPVYFASKQSIVDHKQKQARNMANYKWYSILFSLGLIGLAIYGLYSVQTQELSNTSSPQADSIYVDPVLFFLPAIFIIGLGLFILRLYPILMMGIYLLGRKIWPISLYTTFVQVSRSAKQYQFLMLFLVMTIGIGVYSASAARTINTNLEEQIRYNNGADITVDVRWASSEIATSPSVGNEPSNTEDGTEVEQGKSIVYTEPPFDPFLQLDGVEHATRVFNKAPVKVEAKGSSIFSAELMAIEPNAFGETAWFKSTLLPHHWFNYLNLIASEPSAVLISKSVSTSLGVKEGDYLTMEWEGSDYAEFVVYGVIDYWPSFNPLLKSEDGSDPTLIVANLSYVQNLMGLEPYQIWLQTDTGTQRNGLYENMKQLNLPVTNMDDVQPKLIELKNSAFLLGLNGTMSLGFIISLMITFIGFLLYWILTIKSRTLQYGIYRAMGIPMPKLIAILIWEQVMTSGIACLLGIAIGGITSRLFVPLFQLSFNPQSIVPPFMVMFDPRDEMKIYLFVAFMLVIGLSILVILLRKIKIHQAIKLGED